MFAGQAPPFGWYWSASRSRASAPRPSAIWVTSPVAFGMVRRELAALLGLLVAAAAGGEHDRARVDLVVADPRAPARLELERAARSASDGDARALDRLAQPLRDRVPGPVADLEQALLGRAAALGEPVAAVVAGELDAELLEPVDRALRVAGQHLDEPHVRRLVRALPDVRGVLLGRVLLAERRLDPALRLRGVARLERALGRDRDLRPGAVGGDGGGEPGGAAADHEHVEGEPFRPPAENTRTNATN